MLLAIASTFESPSRYEPVTPESVLGEIRRANLGGHLYLDPVDAERRECIEALAAEIKIEPVLATPASLGGWHVIDSE